jgi:protein SCO1/2
VSARARQRATPLVVVLALVAVVLAGCGGDGGSARPQGLTGAVRTPPLEVASVTLPNETTGAGGAPFTMQAEPGKLLLVYFGFTSCPDICPTTLSDLGRAVQKLPADERDRVDVVMVTVDPARDTGEVMTSYLDTFVPGRGIALRTTDPAQQQAAQDAFRVVAKRVPEGDDNYTFEHTAVTYVVDDRGTVVVEWPFGTAPDAMARDLGILFARADAGRTR